MRDTVSAIARPGAILRVSLSPRAALGRSQRRRTRLSEDRNFFAINPRLFYVMIGVIFNIRTRLPR